MHSWFLLFSKLDNHAFRYIFLVTIEIAVTPIPINKYWFIDFTLNSHEKTNDPNDIVCYENFFIDKLS